MSDQIVLAEPVPPRPHFLGLRLAFWEFCEFFTCVYGPPGPSWRATTLRFTANNYDKPRMCQCGAPGTVRVVPVKSETSYRGEVPPWFWRCDEHADVSLQVCWSGNRPLIGQTREECSWSQSRNDTGLVTICGCGTHVGQLESLRRAP